MNARAIVNESALREMLREALENVGARVGDDDPSPVNVSNFTDRPTLDIDLDAIEVRHLPRTKGELLIMVRNLLDKVDNDQSQELYVKIRDLVSHGGDRDSKPFAHAEEVKPPLHGPEQETPMSKTQVESSFSDVLRQIIAEELGKKMKLGGQWEPEGELPPEEGEIHPDDYNPDDVKFVKDAADEDGPFDVFGEEGEEGEVNAELGASAWDPEDDADEDEGKKKEVKWDRRGEGYGDVGGVTYDLIGQEFGITKEAAKKLVLTAMEKFKTLSDMGPHEMMGLVKDALYDYMEAVSKSPEVTEDDMKFLEDHPEAIMDSEVFREDFLKKHVEKAKRDARADAQALEDEAGE